MYLKNHQKSYPIIINDPVSPINKTDLNFEKTDQNQTIFLIITDQNQTPQTKKTDFWSDASVDSKFLGWWMHLPTREQGSSCRLSTDCLARLDSPFCLNPDF